MTAGWFALLGLTLGALLNWWGARIQRRAGRADARRLEVLDMASAFLRDTDSVWSGRQRLASAVVEIVASPGSEHGRDERLAAFDEMDGPRRDGRLAISRMRLISPSLVETASALLLASEKYSFDNHDDDMATRQGAMTAFEAAVLPLVK
jgi:hypothetical protein